MTARRVVLVPGVPALLPEHAGLVDPVAELRAACHEAVAWLGPDVRVLAGSPSAARVAAYLLGAVASSGAIAARESALVVGNGTATRTEKAPGHLDDRAEAFDADVRAALTRPDPAALAAIDRDLARELWADVDGLVRLGTELITPQHDARVDYDDAPYGVQYWVLRWHRDTSAV